MEGEGGINIERMKAGERERVVEKERQGVVDRARERENIRQSESKIERGR